MPPDLSLKPLDLSRPPGKEELMAAGQLGGALVPTREIRDARRRAAAHLDFGRAIENWNRHEYRQAVTELRRHAREFPDSPWAAEAELHIGCDATYNGRYTEADAIFNKLIAEHAEDGQDGSRRMLGKARQRLALLNVEQNNPAEAEILFESLLDSPDWRHRTYASHWLQRLARYRAAREALLTCGVEALAYAVEQREGFAVASESPGRSVPFLAQLDGGSARRAGEGIAASIRRNLPATMRGHTLANLVTIAGTCGLELVALQVTPADLPQLPLPAILHIERRNPGDSGHFWVLDRVKNDRVEIFDPQSRHRFQQTVDELAREWSGRALVFSLAPTAPTGAEGRGEGAVTPSLPGRRLAPDELEDNSGGCCGAPAEEDNQGDPGDNGDDGDDQDDDPCSNGAPRWKVNVINMNLFVTDTPLWYDPPVGPPVRITVSYNSQSAIAHSEPFGNKWQFSYGGYLVVDTSGSVLLFMPDGRRDTFSPDGAGGYRSPYQVHNTLTRLAENHFELRFPDDTVHVYRIPPGTGSQQPFLTEIRDDYTNRLTLGYDSNVRLTAITAADGKAFTLSYNASGLCTNVADPFGRSARFEYDANRNLTRISDMGGYWSSFAYDSNVYLTSMANERGQWTFWIEPSGGYGNSDNYPPPGDPNMWENYRITITNPLGQTSEYFYYAGCDQDGYGCGGFTWYVSPRDYIPWQSQTVNTYRSRAPKTRFFPVNTGSGRQAEIGRILYPGGGDVRYAYDSSGNRTSTTDSHSPAHTWRYTFNSMGRVTSVTDAKGTPTAFAYAPNGLDLLTLSNGLGQIQMAYNTQHNLVSLTDRLTNTTTFAYNTKGQIVSRVDALGITNEYLYDPDQRLAEFRRAGQTLERFTYDAVGRVRTRTDATGLTVTNDYNALNQVVRVTYPDGRFESYAYSTCCPRLLDSVTDRGGRTTVFIHDALKRLIQTVNPEGGITQLGYDANGNRRSLTDPNGNVTTFAYDLDNRLIRKTYADGKGLSFRYDADGLLTTRTNARGITTAYTYDANHNLLTTAYSDATPGVTNTYDAFNRLSLVEDGVGTNAYAYDANSRLASFDGPWADDTITYAFDALGRRTNLLVQGSQPTGYDYDALNRLTGVRVGADLPRGGQAYVYTYPGASPLVQRLERPNGSFTTYQYDGLNRLTALSNRRSTGEVINEFLYAYNAQDLRAGETGSNRVALTFTNQHVTYDYNRLNQLLTSAPPSQVFAYDEDGNMTRGFTPKGLPFIASYDAENRLKLILVTNTTSPVLIAFAYSWNGFLAAEKHEVAGQTATWLRYVRAGYFELQQRDINNAVQLEFAWNLNRPGGVGTLLALKKDDLLYDYTYDGRANVATVLSAAQNPVANYTYDAFGTVLSASETIEQPFHFATKAYDRSTGLTYFGFRFYAPALGRWTSRDPIEEADDNNLYAYARNDPVTYADFIGLSTGCKIALSGFCRIPGPGKAICEILKSLVCVEELNPDEKDFDPKKYCREHPEICKLPPPTPTPACNP